MVIELWYDPVLPETFVRIKGQWIDSRDPYGFLYQVRNYPLKGWLEQTGSWPGLTRQIGDIARGEAIRLVFCGRRCDYADFAEAMAAYSPEYRTWETLPLWQARLESAEKALQQLRQWQDGNSGKCPDGFVEASTRVAQALAPIDADEWLARLNGEDDCPSILLRRESCCEVSGEWLSSFSQLERLRQFTRPMCRFPDMICCVMENEASAVLFRDYAAQVPRLAGFRFCTESQWPGVREGMYEKYGLPMTLRARAGRIRDAADFLMGLTADYEAASDRLSRLQFDIAADTAGSSRVEEEEALRMKLQYLTVIRRGMPGVLEALSGVGDALTDT